MNQGLNLCRFEPPNPGNQPLQTRNEKMKTKCALPMVLAGSVLLAGCFDDDDPIKTSVRVVHASSDAPAVNVRVNGDVVVSGADYKQAAVLTPNASLTQM